MDSTRTEPSTGASESFSSEASTGSISCTNASSESRVASGAGSDCSVVDSRSAAAATLALVRLRTGEAAPLEAGSEKGIDDVAGSEIRVVDCAFTGERDDRLRVFTGDMVARLRGLSVRVGEAVMETCSSSTDGRVDNMRAAIRAQNISHTPGKRSQQPTYRWFGSGVQLGVQRARLSRLLGLDRHLGKVHATARVVAVTHVEDAVSWGPLWTRRVHQRICPQRCRPRSSGRD